MDINAYTFYNFPKELKVEDYEKAKETFISALSKLNSVKSIYQFGTVSTPGISDLDFFVVLDDIIGQERNRLKSAINSFTETEKYIFSHEPFFVNKELFMNYLNIRHVSNLQHIYGEKIQMKKEVNKNCKIYMLIEILLSYPNFFLDSLIKKKIDVRKSLQILNAIKYPISIYNDVVGNNKDRYSDFIEEISNIRDNYHEHSNEDIKVNLLRLIYQAINIIREVKWEFHNYLLDKLVYF